MNRSTTRAAAPLGLWLACLLCLGAAAPAAQAQLAPPTRSSPSRGAVNVPTTVELRWQPVSGAVGYEWRLLRNRVIARSGSLQGVSATQVTLPNLYAGQVYTWQVRALANRERNHSRWPNAWRFTTVNTVTLLTPEGGAQNVSMPVTFSWTPLSGVSRYEVQTSVFPRFRNGTRTAASHTSLQMHLGNTGNRTWYWRVRGFEGNKALPWSQPRSFVTAAPASPPPGSGGNGGIVTPPPSNMHPPTLRTPASGAGVTVVNARSMNLVPVRFQWGLFRAKRPFTCHFELYRGAGIDAGQRIVDQRVVSASALDQLVTPMREYTWRVGLQSANGQVLWSVPSTFTALGTVVAGRGERYDGGTSIPPSLFWMQHPGAAGYEVEVFVRTGGTGGGGMYSGGSGSGNSGGGSVGVVVGGRVPPPGPDLLLLQRYRVNATDLILNHSAERWLTWRIRALGDGPIVGPWSDLRNLY